MLFKTLKNKNKKNQKSLSQKHKIPTFDNKRTQKTTRKTPKKERIATQNQRIGANRYKIRLSDTLPDSLLYTMNTGRKNTGYTRVRYYFFRIKSAQSTQRQPNRAFFVQSVNNRPLYRSGVVAENYQKIRFVV